MPAWFFVTKWLSNLPQQKKGFLSWVFKRRCPWLQIANISNIIGLPIFFNFYQAQTSRVFITWLKSRQLYLRGIPFPKRQFVLFLTPFKSTEPRSANLAVPEVMSEGRSGLKVNKQRPPPYLGRIKKSALNFKKHKFVIITIHLHSYIKSWEIFEMWLAKTNSISGKFEILNNKFLILKQWRKDSRLWRERMATTHGKSRKWKQ